MNRGRTLSYEISTNKYRNGLTSCKRVYLEMTFVRKELLTFILGGCSFDKNFLKRLKRGYYERQGFNQHILKGVCLLMIICGELLKRAEMKYKM